MALERRTYLISTVVAYLFGLVLFTTLLFVYTGEHIHGLFVGAMCAAGTLNVNSYGYPLLVLKIINFFLCGLWLILNYTDSQGADYPIIRTKYRFLVVISLLLAIESWLTLNYFRGLQANVITSCCGTLFSTDTQSIAGDLASLPSYATKVFLFLGFALVLRSGIHFFMTGQGGKVYAYLSTGLFAFSLAAIIAVISVHYYELPTHHCPFCLLQAEYNYIGYPLYLTLFTAGITGAGIGVIDRFKEMVSLRAVIPKLQKKLCLTSMIGYIIFIVISVYPMIFSDFKLEGY